MPHYPKPFFRSDRGLWYVQLRGRQHNLGVNRDDAFRRYHELMRAPEPVASQLVVGLIDGFLDWCSKHRSPRTYEGHKWHLQRFINQLPDAASMTVDRLKPHHILAWVDAHPEWGPTYRRNAITSVQRAFLWAEKVGHIAKSPVRYVEKPMAARREQVVSASEFQRLLSFVKGRHFRDLLEFCWETGARPQEARAIEARHYNAARSRLEIPPAEAKGKNRWRIIYLTSKAEEIVRRLARHHRTGAIFRNRSGKSWTTSSINGRFCRLQKKLGTKYALYSLRHSFATRLLEAGSDPLTVSALLGHADGSMLARVYSHLGESMDHLRNSLSRLEGKGAGALPALESPSVEGREVTRQPPDRTPERGGTQSQPPRK
jgi:integrase